jgi:hypothetical protein
LLTHHCNPGEIADVIDHLPEEIKELWLETARDLSPPNSLRPHKTQPAAAHD